MLPESSTMARRVGVLIGKAIAALLWLVIILAGTPILALWWVCDRIARIGEPPRDRK